MLSPDCIQRYVCLPPNKWALYHKIYQNFNTAGHKCVYKDLHMYLEYIKSDVFNPAPETQGPAEFSSKPISYTFEPCIKVYRITWKITGSCVEEVWKQISKDSESPEAGLKTSALNRFSRIYISSIFIDTYDMLNIATVLTGLLGLTLTMWKYNIVNINALFKLFGPGNCLCCFSL